MIRTALDQALKMASIRGFSSGSAMDRAMLSLMLRASRIVPVPAGSVRIPQAARIHENIRLTVGGPGTCTRKGGGGEDMRVPLGMWMW